MKLYRKKSPLFYFVLCLLIFLFTCFQTFNFVEMNVFYYILVNAVHIMEYVFIKPLILMFVLCLRKKCIALLKKQADFTKIVCARTTKAWF